MNIDPALEQIEYDLEHALNGQWDCDSFKENLLFSFDQGELEGKTAEQQKSKTAFYMIVLARITFSPNPTN